MEATKKQKIHGTKYVNLPWELEEDILLRIPAPSLARLKFVCKRWNTLLTGKSFIANHLARARPQFILCDKSKIYSIEVDLAGPSIKVHDLSLCIPDYICSKLLAFDNCDGLVVCATNSPHKIAVCNPSLRQIKWIKPKSDAHPDLNGIGYDNTRPDHQYNIFTYNVTASSSLKARIIKLESEETKSYEFAYDDWNIFWPSFSVSLKGTLYWVASNPVACEYFIQSFDVSMERFTPFCALPSKRTNLYDHRCLAVFKGDRFSYLERCFETGNIDVWVTKEKISHGDREAVEWLTFMNVVVSASSDLRYGNWFDRPRYFIAQETLSLVLSWMDMNKQACIFILKGDQLRQIRIEDLHPTPRYRPYLSSLVPLQLRHKV